MWLKRGGHARGFACYPRLSRVTRRWFWAVPVIAALSILIGLLEGLGVGLLVPLVSTLAQAPGVPVKNPVLGHLEQFAHQAGFQNRLLIITAAILGVTMLKSLMFTASRIFSSTLYGRVGHDIRLRLSDAIEKARYEFFLQADSAHLVNVLNAQSWQAVDAVRASFIRVASVSILTVMGLILLFIEWRLALIVAGGGLIARAVQRVFIGRIKAMSLRGTKFNDALTSRMMFSIFGARVIRLFDEGEAEHRRFMQASDRVRGELLAVDRTAAMLSPALETFHAFLFVAVLLVAVRWGVQLPLLAAFLVLFNRMQPHLRALEQASGTYAAASGQLRDVDWLLDPDNMKAREDGDMPFTGFSSHIRFDHVSLDYQAAGDRSPALSDVDFTIRRGTAFAVIGESGAGKSSLINLLAGLIEPTRGEIRVDGVPLNRVRRDEWLGAIAIAGQDIDLFEGTIAENIAFGMPDADETMIAAAARDADAGFILSLPAGFSTRVGDRGLALSGGQRQRIGIARALIRKPKILILDEATNALDRPSENVIVDAIGAMPQGTTTIVISHRSATLRLCDAGIVLDNGRMIEIGPLDTLAEYRAMRDREIGLPDPDMPPAASHKGGWS